MQKTKPDILIATLGSTWMVIPEAYASLYFDNPVLKNHGQIKRINRVRNECLSNGKNKSPGLNKNHELWVITSGDETATKGIKQIQQWWKAINNQNCLRIFQAIGSGKVTTDNELSELRELTFRVVLQATEIANRVVMSLAGGRKTMSADLQRAASIFGCSGIIHIVIQEPMPDFFNYSNIKILNNVNTWLNPLTEEQSSAISPVFLGKYIRSDYLDIDWQDKGAVTSDRFPLNNSTHDLFQIQCSGTSLTDEINAREAEGGQLLNNFLINLDLAEKFDNWRHLYRLPGKLLDWLSKEPLTEKHLPLIIKLPKAELHCHIGGILTLQQQVLVAKKILENKQISELKELKKILGFIFQSEGKWPAEWVSRIKDVTEFSRSECAAYILSNCDYDELEYNLYSVTEPRKALKISKGFSSYELPGELSGSALLSNISALQEYAYAIVDYVKKENITYLELRGSPTKYCSSIEQSLLWLSELKRFTKSNDHRIHFIIIADRRNEEQCKAAIQLATVAREKLENFIAGIDIAGDESPENSLSADHLLAIFKPAFEQCIPVTIHAGEGESSENIWDASYKLHADRVGHCLTLKENQSLLNRFRDKGIAIELCPTSNNEVIGFWEEGDEPNKYPKYPLQDYLKEGLRVTINSDNPGISRTTLSQEFLQASKMCEKNYLTLWRAFAIHKQGFINALLSRDERELLIRQTDAQIYQIVHSYWLSTQKNQN